MAKILFLAHRVPFPTNKGDKIRAQNIVTGLAERHDIWLGAGADDLADLQYEGAAREFCRDVYFAPLGAARRNFNMAMGLLRGEPLSVARFHHPGLAQWVDRVLREVQPQIVMVFSSAMARYVVGRLPPGTRMIIEFGDADAEKWRTYAEKRTPLRPIYRREFQRLVRFETRALAAADAGVLVSQPERRAQARLLPVDAAKLHVIPSGVDVDYFTPTPGPGDGCSIVFCGRMDYLPNIDAAQWFAREILPIVQHRRPDAKFRIVGAGPPAAIKALTSLPGVEVTGAVPDVRPYLAQASVVVAPLRIARGIQNKVLEGMAAARPVVATPEALEGLAAVPGRDLLVARGATGVADAVITVLDRSASADLGSAGRAYVLAHHQWPVQVRAFERLVAGAGRFWPEAVA